MLIRIRESPIFAEGRGRRSLRRRSSPQGVRGREQGAALVEFALVLPILLLLLLGIIDFGFYFYNDLQLTQVARDAIRYVSVGKVAEANATIAGATLISTTINTQSIDAGSTGTEATVTLTATYSTITPLPGLAGLDTEFPINATAKMRRE